MVEKKNEDARKKEQMEYVNMSLMNLTKAIEKSVIMREAQNECILKMNGVILDVCTKLGAVSWQLKVLSEKLEKK